MAQRQSVAAQTNAINLRSSGLLMPGSANLGVGREGAGKRPAPPPLKLGPGSIGGGGLRGETIMEVVSPAPSPLTGSQRFPKMAFVGNHLI